MTSSFEPISIKYFNLSFDFNSFIIFFSLSENKFFIFLNSFIAFSDIFFFSFFLILLNILINTCDYFNCITSFANCNNFWSIYFEYSFELSGEFK